MRLTRETKIGIIFVGAILALIWGLQFLKGKNLFSTSDTYYAVYSDIQGLAEANPVQVNGYQVGQVADIHFLSSDNHKLVVKMDIETKFKIPENSTAKIFSSDLMGSKAVKILLSNKKSYHEEGDTLRTKVEQSISNKLESQIIPLKDKTERVLVSLDSFISNVFGKKGRNDLRQSFRNLNHTTAQLDTLMQTERQKIAAITANLRSMSKSLQANEEKIDRIFHNFAMVSDSLAASRFKSTVANAEASLGQLDKMIREINQSQGTMGQLIYNDSLYRNLTHTTDKLNDLLEDMKENPHRYIQFSLFGGN